MPNFDDDDSPCDPHELAVLNLTGAIAAAGMMVQSAETTAGLASMAAELLALVQLGGPVHGSRG